MKRGRGWKEREESGYRWREIERDVENEKETDTEEEVEENISLEQIQIERVEAKG